GAHTSNAAAHTGRAHSPKWGVSLPGQVRLRLKSARAKVMRHGARYRVIGVARGGTVAAVPALRHAGTGLG
ncbi:MAG: hypothetical protein JWN47_484, partial [Frankiales bacterium]|nr:hypothetical protein [Frankiales bacterium]